MTIGENAQVDGGTKNLAFFRSPTPAEPPPSAARGWRPPATSSSARVAARIVSNGGTVSGDEVQLRASQGIGAPSAA